MVCLALARLGWDERVQLSNCQGRVGASLSEPVSIHRHSNCTSRLLTRELPRRICVAENVEVGVGIPRSVSQKKVYDL